MNRGVKENHGGGRGDKMMKYERETYSKRYSNWKKVFFNHTRMLQCYNCQKDLKESYVCSSNRRKVRCLDCAEKHKIIPNIPEECR